MKLRPKLRHWPQPLATMTLGPRSLVRAGRQAPRAARGGRRRWPGRAAACGGCADRLRSEGEHGASAVGRQGAPAGTQRCERGAPLRAPEAGLAGGQESAGPGPPELESPLSPSNSLQPRGKQAGLLLQEEAERSRHLLSHTVGGAEMELVCLMPHPQLILLPPLPFEKRESNRKGPQNLRRVVVNNPQESEYIKRMNDKTFTIQSLKSDLDLLLHPIYFLFPTVLINFVLL